MYQSALFLLLCIFAVCSAFSPVSRSFGSRSLMMNNAERTYIMIKPDGVQRGLIGNIIGRFEAKGFQLKALKLVTPTEKLLKEHYCDLVSKVRTNYSLLELHPIPLTTTIFSYQSHSFQLCLDTCCQDPSCPWCGKAKTLPKQDE